MQSGGLWFFLGSCPQVTNVHFRELVEHHHIFLQFSPFVAGTGFLPAPSPLVPEGFNGLIVWLHSSCVENITLSGQKQRVGSIKSLFVKSAGLLLEYTLWFWHGSLGTSRTLVLSSMHDLQLSPLYYPPVRAVPRGAPSHTVLGQWWLCQIKRKARPTCSAVWQRPGKEICVDVKSRWIP